MTKKRFTQIISVFLTAILAYQGGSVFAQSFYENDASVINFVNIGESQRLSHPVVYDVEQDAEGFIWIATQGGLNRYDGRSLTLFSYSPNDPISISSNWVWDIHLDSEGRLWLASENGFHLFLEEQSGFRNFNKQSEGSRIQGDKYRVIAEAPNGEIWFGSQDSGITILNPETFEFRQIIAQPNVDSALQSNKIRDIQFDQAGNVWVATQGGGVSWARNGESSFTSYTVASELSLPSNNIRTLNADQNGNIWVGTEDAGAVVLNPKTESISAAFSNQDFISQCSRVVRDIHEDKMGVTRVATDNGLCQWDADKQSFILYQHKQTNVFSLISNNVNSLFQDAGGVIWVGTYEGVSRWNALIKPFRHVSNEFPRSEQLSSNVISAFATSQDGTLFVGTWGKGINVIDPKSGQITTIRHEPNNLKGLQDDRIMSLHVDSNDNLWVGTFNGGLHRKLKGSDEFQVWQADANDSNALSANAVSSLLMLSNGTLAAGTYGGGLNLLDPSGTFTVLKAQEDEASALKNNRITSLFESDGYLWIGTHGGGISQYNLASQQFNHFNKSDSARVNIGSDNVFSVLTTDKAVWLATQDVGVVKLTKPTSGKDYQAFFYNRSTGLSADFAYGLLQDKYGYIWVSHSHGLSRISPTSDEIFNFNRTHGLQGLDFNSGSYHQSKEGRLFFGGANGFNTFMPDQVPINNYQPPIRLTRFKLQNQVIPIYRAFRSDGVIELEYDETFVDFEFASLDYTRPENNHYLYKIDQLNDTWIDLENNNHVAFSSLGDGRYTLRIKASNSDQIWGNKELVIPITVLPPLWRSNQALAAYAVITFLIFWLLYQKRRKKLLAQERYREHLEREVQHRTTDLEKANSELAAAIEQAEAAREAAEQAAKAKASFLATMSHEIRTPMNSIIGMSEMLNHTSVDATQNQYISSIKKAGETLLSLINDVLDYSKMDAGKIELDIQPLNLNELIDDTAFLFASQAAEKGVEMVTNVAFDAPDIIKGDALRLRQVLQNLISNAIKFTHTGYVEVSVTTENSKLLIQVTDTGIGINESGLERIFNAFEQADSSTTRRFGGTGLGLSICKKMIHAMDGEISVESQENKGSCFTVSIPLHVVQHHTSETLSDALSAATFTIAIDNLPVKSMVLSIMQRLNLNYTESEESELNQKLTSTREDKTQFIVIDESLLENSSTLALLNEYQQNVLVLRAMTLEQNAQRDDFLSISKPIKRMQFKALLESWIQGESVVNDLAKRDSDYILNYDAKILLVEDVVTNQEVATAMLSLFNCTIDIANNGAEAVELFKHEHYDLVLMDCQMPTMDGFEATTMIREFEKQSGKKATPIVALTAGVSEDNKEMYSGAGMNGHLMKPFTARQLSTLLGKFIQPKAGATPLSRFTKSKTPVLQEPNESADELIDYDVIKAIKEIEIQTNKRIYHKVLTLFMREFKAKLVELTDALAKNDMESLTTVAHAMKSLSANVGAIRLKELCSSLENGSEKLSQEEIMALKESLETCYDASVPRLQKYAEEQ